MMQKAKGAWLEVAVGLPWICTGAALTLMIQFAAAWLAS